ncbi:hypothetical protein BU24DRAFT_228411 [Aaosphaeria arxii CBS 175.79]|uniref:Aminoglycoside phosphotransferase domain-containing protein n=1 Tax=Aaosphaeria arxii CBS 175.79 TaxID=1450172 RepID=A0A6A5XS71_9PLEO|nr:uncharacterized protein BU24DRAFT_228411 [Aaosphaeria arxii CBS 175.79]KAF2015114.1 hypothetical protein BU24DRAFT_228411 [Aaosphaeria arxii CBS 175.79]
MVMEFDLTSPRRLEHWFCRRLPAGSDPISFSHCDFVMCHLDVAPRNIVWMDDDIPCFVDWASGGYYPRVFEWCTLEVMRGRDGEFQEKVQKMLEPLTEWEMDARRLVVKAWGNSVRYHYPPTPPDTSD